MMLTTKGRYAVMAMVDITVYANNRPVTLSDIEQRQGITIAYLEQLFSKLKKQNLVKSVRGPGGGYLLAKDSSHIKVSDIIMAVDEAIKMTRCNHNPTDGCVAGTRCLTHDLWDGLGNQIFRYLNSVTLADVCNKRIVTEQDFKELPISEQATA